MCPVLLQLDVGDGGGARANMSTRQAREILQEESNVQPVVRTTV
jgi:hypothetical protein